MSKRNLVGFALLLVLSFGTVCLAKVTDQRSSVPGSAMSQIQQTVGETDAYMGPTRFPDFKAAKSATASEVAPGACGPKMEASEKDGGYSSALMPDNQYQLRSQKDYETVPGLVIDNLEIPAANRKTTKMLVTWTIRVEGDQPMVVNPICRPGCNNKAGNWEEPCSTLTPGYRPMPCVCEGLPWHGQVDQNFLGGPVKSKLYLNGVAVGEVASMTMPEAFTKHVSQVYDPTISGSFMIDKEFFPGGIFPAKIDRLEVKWYNDTSMRIKSPANTRMIVITVMPITSSLSTAK